MFETINRLLGFMGDLLEAHPNQHSTGNVISDDPGFAALATFQASQLLGFTVKLLDLPTKATHLLYGLRVVLRHVIGYDIIRALGRKHHPEEFHFVIARKTLDLDNFAALLLGFCPFERIDSSVRLRTARIIDLAVVFERAVVDFLALFNRQHDFLGRIPTVHQDGPELQLLLVNTVQKHVLNVIEFALAVSVWVVNPIVDDPKLIQVRIDIHTSDDPDALDDALCVSAVLPSHQFDCMRVVLVGHRIIEDKKPLWGLNDLAFHIFPDQFGRQAFSSHIAIERIVTEFLAVVGKVRQRIIDLADQKVLAIVQACDGLCFGSHAPKLTGFSPTRQPLSFA